ncbi:MAG TPA: ThuA domain-containing protein [Acidimicrobiales bacterium]|jgi:type 1 glutamine amidotransferase
MEAGGRAFRARTKSTRGVKRAWRFLSVLALVVAVAAACGSDDAGGASGTSTTVTSSTAGPATSAPDRPAVLVLTKTAGFRHTSIEPAAAALVAGLGAAGIDVVVDPDAAHVTVQGLAPFNAVVMLSTTGDWLDDAQQTALEQWAAAGGGIAGIHAATDAEAAWPFLEDLFGTRFVNHSTVQPATVVIEDPTHPATVRLPTRWAVTDEWYNFTRNPRDRVHVLATVDETTYAGGGMGPDHPIEWSREPSAISGRMWYTAMGHPDELWADPVFAAHVVAGVAWTAGVSMPGVTSLTTGVTASVAARRTTQGSP